MAQISHMQAASLRNGNTYCGNIIGGSNNTSYKPNEGAQIIRRLSPLEPNSRYQGMRTD